MSRNVDFIYAQALSVAQLTQSCGTEIKGRLQRIHEFFFWIGIGDLLLGSSTAGELRA